MMTAALIRRSHWTCMKSRAGSFRISMRRSHYIPDVCRELGLPCVSLLGLMRREKWVF